MEKFNNDQEQINRLAQEAFLLERKRVADESGVPENRLYKEGDEWYINDGNNKKSVKDWLKEIEEKSKQMLEEHQKGSGSLT